MKGTFVKARGSASPPSCARSRLCSTSARGFTLFEVLVSIALILGLLGSMFAFSFELLASRDHALELAAKHRAATVLIDQLERDVMTCVAGDPRHGPGIAGDGSSMRILARSVAASLAEQGPEHAPAFGDLQHAAYRFTEAGGGTLEVARDAAMGNGAAPQHTMLGENIYKIRFRYHDGSQWRTRFDSLQNGTLPLAIEVAIWFDPWPGEDVDDETELLDLNAAAENDRNASLFDDEDVLTDAFGEFDEPELDDGMVPMPDRIRVIAVADAISPRDEGPEP